MKLLGKTIVLVVLAHCLAEKVRYDNHKLYRIVPKDVAAFEALKDLENVTFSGYNFWTPVQGLSLPVDIMVSPDELNNFESMLASYKLDPKVIMENVQEYIDKEGLRPESKAGRFGWSDYHTLDEINNWLESLSEAYPGIVTLIKAGRSYEGRELTGVKVSFSPLNADRAIFMEAGIHAREWISPAVNTWILNELLTSTNRTVRAFAENYDWYFFPVFNPDGFVFTHTNNRLYRKTRVPYGLLCFGADPNRNWGFHWNTGGASNIACADTYAGPSAFSEPCVQVMADYISTVGTSLVGYISFHSYSQMLLLPFGHTTAHLENYSELMHIGTKGIEALAKRYGTDYVIGNIAETIYVASGGSMDWVKGTFHTPVTYTYELRDVGQFGFLLPAEQIIPTALETFDSLITIFEEYEKL